MKKEIKKEWFLDRYCNHQFAVFVEDGKTKEIAFEKEPRGVCVGTIYKGRVTNVLSGMDAVFINCGLGKNCYLSTQETYADYTKYDSEKGIQLNPAPTFSVGDEVVVQVTKPPRGNKGAKVTTLLSFVGKTVIYLPNTDFLGISRKITDEKVRERLTKTVGKFRERDNEGFIIRTQAPFATTKQLRAEAKYLKTLYEETLAQAKDAPVGKILYEDEDLPARVMRDCYGEEISAIHVGDEELYNRLLRFIRLRKDISPKKLHLYNGERSMFKEYGISSLLYEVAQPTVPLKNGGYLVIEQTEAMTVVDVNTGSFVGDTNHEETVFAVNLEAAREIARQVRLRNVGGIVVVDFIDMADEKHREEITAELTKCLAEDRAKCKVLPMSELCLTQFTRKRVGSEVGAYLEKTCPHCGGVGYVHADIFVVSRIRAQILEVFANGYTSAIVDLNEGIMQTILREGLLSIEAKCRWKDKQVYFIPHKTYKEDCFTVRGEISSVLTLPNNAQVLY